MIVDTSAILALTLDEDDAERIAIALQARMPRMSIASYLELGVVCDRLAPDAWPPAEALIARAGITLEPVTEVQGRVAREAHRRFGRGSGHAARLNFGDCFVYALAKETGEPILCKGNDFAQTDAVIAAY